MPRLYLALATFAAVAVFATGYLLQRDRRVETRTVAKIEKSTANAEIQTPATTKILDDLPRVQNSTLSPCWQQQQIAAQRSYIATVLTKRDTVYKAPCEIDPKKPVRVAEKKQ
jgi:hypothetical protein